ncbi:hypothetical protein SAMN05192583_1265 [Sphingomonas gellani]|uniref:PRC-barrel domain-containing protein n=1 Tax=Sphingomonas gellani TaxID=1166340 RepID=A0A1H8BBT5_9SPHN|nr:hypothetical protein [Sphingomonas gellani]SEM79468.1 hypothetical protein SAMN05192583_1265 [Sphingomonas gellani]
MRNSILAAGMLAALTAVPALAQTSPAPAAAPAAGQTTTPTPAAQAGVPAAPAQVNQGAAVFDLTGASIGTVVQINGTTAVVDTGTNKVGVPVGNFAAGPNGLVLSNTKADLDAAAGQAAAQSQAQLKTMLVAGTAVHGVNGQVLGKVKSADAELVTVTSAKGGDVRLPASGFAVTPAGLTVGIAQADFDKAVAASRK